MLKMIIKVKNFSVKLNWVQSVNLTGVGSGIFQGMDPDPGFFPGSGSDGGKKELKFGIKIANAQSR